MSDIVRGRFITFEGGEGAGKTPQLALLSKGLRNSGISVLQTREPGGSIGAEEIRQLLVKGEVTRWDTISEALLNFAARHDHLQKTIEPALLRGDWVLCDRFADSTMAYQGFGFELGREAVEVLQQFAIGEFKPDLTLILDVSVKEGLLRTKERIDEENRYERMDIEFHERVRNGFHEIAKHDPERCVLIDTQIGKQEVQKTLRQIISKNLKVKFS